MTSVQAPVSRDQIIQSIQLASAETGVDFDYLLDTARRESSLKPQAKAKTSTAAGLFQFIEQTWLGAVKQYGDKAGIGELRKAINTDESGRHIVTDAERKQEILALRHDVKVSSYIAGMMTRDSQAGLENRLGRELNEGELYISHFMGVTGAAEFISAYEEDPSATAAVLFPKAAKANKSLFYGPGGIGLSLAEVYGNLTDEKNSVPAAPVKASIRPVAKLPTAVSVNRTAPSRPATGDLRLASFSDLPLPVIKTAGSNSKLPASLVDLSPVVLDLLAAIGEDHAARSGGR